MKLLVFAASHRKESINRVLARLAATIAQSARAGIDFAEYGEFDVPLYDDELFSADAIPARLMQFAERLAAADGVMIATPEYNWSFPGSLKNLIDWASRLSPDPFSGKTAFLMSASPSARGGVLGLTHLRVPLEALGVVVYPHVFTLGAASQALHNGLITDVKQAALLEQRVEGFVAMTKKLIADSPAVP